MLPIREETNERPEKASRCAVNRLKHSGMMASFYDEIGLNQWFGICFSKELPIDLYSYEFEPRKYAMRGWKRDPVFAIVRGMPKQVFKADIQSKSFKPGILIQNLY